MLISFPYKSKVYTRILKFLQALKLVRISDFYRNKLSSDSFLVLISCIAKILEADARSFGKDLDCLKRSEVVFFELPSESSSTTKSCRRCLRVYGMGIEPQERRKYLKVLFLGLSVSTDLSPSLDVPFGEPRWGRADRAPTS